MGIPTYADFNSIPNGRYRITAVMYKSNVSTIYFARNIFEHWILVLKKFHLENSRLDEHGSLQLEADSRRYQDFRHAAIPRIFDYFIERDSDHLHRNFYVAMDYINGRDLEGISRMMSKPIPYLQLKKWAIELCDVLAAMHAESMYFGLLCPRHIMVNHHGQIRLVDLGIGSSLNAGNNVHITHYLPPDYSQMEPSAANDIYSLGATLYDLTAHLGASSLDEIRTPSKRALIANATSSFADIILKSLAHDPQARFQSIEQMRMAFLELP